MTQDLESLFGPVLIASRDASLLALAAAGLLWVFGRRIAPGWRHAIWLLVAVRLLMPSLPSSSVSLQTVWQEKPAAVRQADQDVRPESASVPVPARVEVALPASEPKETASPVSSPPPVRVQGILALIWMLGMAVLFAFYAVIVVRFQRRLLRLTFAGHSRVARVSKLLGELTAELALSRTPALRITDAVPGPALTGLFRPEILLPPSSLDRLDDGQLRLVLLHELAHLRRGDTWTQSLLALLRAVHWFNPFVWWAFHRAGVEAERASDAWVLSRSDLSRATEYGEALLRLLEPHPSRATPSLPGVVGVAENARDLRWRFRAIQSFSRKRSRVATAGAALLFLGMATVGLTQAPKQKETGQATAATPENAGEKAAPAEAGKGNTVIVSVIERISNRAVVNAAVQIRSKAGQGQPEWSAERTTNAEGTCEFSLPEGLSNVRATVHKDGQTPWETWIRPPKTFTFRLDPVVSIGGTVVDERGQPIAGAAIDVSWWLQQANIPRDYYQWGIDDPDEPIRTGADGRWRYDKAPQGFAMPEEVYSGEVEKEGYHLRVQIAHPRYRPLDLQEGSQGKWREGLLAGTASITLADCCEVTGTITDEKGTPIAGASIQQLVSGSDKGKSAKSGEDGRFSLYLEPGNHEVFLQAKGFAGELRRLSVPLKNAPSDAGRIALKPARPLHFRVITTTGKPVPNADVIAEQKPGSFPRQRHTLLQFETDPNGEYIWESAPDPGGWVFTCLKQGFFALRDQSPRPQGDTLTIVLSKAIRVTGTIIDAGTGKPISEFRLLPGQRMPEGDTIWHPGNARTIRNAEGRYTLTVDDAHKPAFRVEVKGYVSSVSRDYPVDSQNKNPREDFALQAIGKMPVLHVEQPDGKPAAGAKLLVRAKGHNWLIFENLRVSGGSSEATEERIADDHGRLSFPQTPAPYQGWIVHPSGFLQVNNTLLREAVKEPVRLRPFTRLTGTLLLDGKPGAGQTLEVSGACQQPGNPEEADFWAISARTQDDGTFVAERLVPIGTGYFVYRIDPLTGKRIEPPMAKAAAPDGKPGEIRIDHSIAKQVRVKGHFVTRRGESLKNTTYVLANIYVSTAGSDRASPESYEMRLHWNLMPEKDGSFTTIPLSPGSYHLKGDFQFSNGGLVPFQGDWLIPGDARQKADEGMYEMGDIRIDYPLEAQ